MREVGLDDVAASSYSCLVIVVGIRELKNRLSEYLRLVRAGEHVLVTDRGEVVAEIRGPRRDAEPAPSAVELLARAGVLRPGAPNDPSVYPRFEPLLSEDRVARLLGEERGTR